ncbi:MAG: cation:proton antiporter, partial [Synergistaceae bacterium]|nr:cation:proton antiporter [Synergistaceae bacterium]
MFAHFVEYLHQGSPASIAVITVALMLMFGFALTRVTKLLKLPNVTAYIITGILIGPYCLNLVPDSIAESTAFLPNVALSFIAFSTGQFFRLNALRGNGAKVLVITVLEACVASVFVFIAAYWVLGMDLAFSAVIAALASATAPASTMMTIRQTGAHGDFVNTLLQVVALDDVVGL